ncbi:MAG: OmpA family protein [Chlamydiota bacterium]|nr:OmpA family protein [Chlamydiota bacterium]
MKYTFYLFMVILCSCVSGCFTRSHSLWEGTKTATRYIEYQGKKFFSKGDSDSRLVNDTENFLLDRERGMSTDGVVLHKEILPTLASSVASHEILYMGSLYFETDAHVTKDKESHNTLRELALDLKRDPSLKLRVEGHCDERASEAYNLALGLRRARGIEELLIKWGAPPSSLEAISFGKERPAVLGSRPSDWEKNRRVELKLITPKKRG